MPINNAEQVPVNVVGSSKFGRYPKISAERTYNMYVSDEWLINLPGFKLKTALASSETTEGRGAFHSIRGGFVLIVVGSVVYRLNANLAPVFIGTIGTSMGEVFLDENLNSQICIVDGQDAYIYSYVSNALTPQTLTHPDGVCIPNYVCYHNTFFLFGSNPNSVNPQLWFAFVPDAAGDPINDIIWNSTFSISTKPDSAIAIKRLPGRGNNVIVFGFTVAEIWTQVAATSATDILPYRRVQSFNIDNGTVAVETIAASEEFVAWIGQNENNNISLMISEGTSVKRISTDGIDHLLDTIQFPDQATGLIFKESGHLFYQFTFFNPVDNLTMVYDFNADAFYDLTDENSNFHPARQVVFFNLKTYFISLNDAGFYQMGSEFISYDYDTTPASQGQEIPRIRVCNTVRQQDSRRFRAGSVTLRIEQGIDLNYIINSMDIIQNGCDGELITEIDMNPIVTELGLIILAEFGSCNNLIANQLTYQPRVDLSISKNGNASYSNIVSRYLNPIGDYRNIMKWARPLGQCNELTLQFRFWGFQRMVLRDAILETW